MRSALDRMNEDENFVFVFSQAHIYRLQIEKIKATISRIGKVKIIDGFTLVPHVSECFYDYLHPNAWGMQIYADNLVEELNR